MKLTEKLGLIQADLKTNVEKSVKKGHGLQYDYSKESDVLAVIKPLLEKHKLAYALSQGQEYKLQQAGRGWVYESMGTFTLFDTEAETNNQDSVLTLAVFFTGENNDPAKAYGSALTYGVKFALKKIFGLPDDELDPDNEQGEKPKANKSDDHDQNGEALFWDLVFQELKNKTQKGEAMMELINQWLNGQPATTSNIKNATDETRRKELANIMNGVKKDNE